MERLIKEIRELDDKILDFLLDIDSQEQYDAEYSEIEEYYVRFDQITLKFNMLSRNTLTEDNTVSVKSNKLKLPKIELRKFCGDISEWLGFWSQFQRIHNDPDLEKEDKFQYLIQATSEGSKAREVVICFPPIASNYDKAIQALKNRFVKDEILIEFYVRELLNLVIMNVTPKPKFSHLQLYDKLELHLRSLESLGVTGDRYAALLFPLVESSLPEDLLRIWLRASAKCSVNDTHMSFKNENCDRLNQILTFLKNEVEGEQRVMLAQGGFQTLQQKPTKLLPVFEEGTYV